MSKIQVVPQSNTILMAKTKFKADKERFASMGVDASLLDKISRYENVMLGLKESG